MSDRAITKDFVVGCPGGGQIACRTDMLENGRCYSEIGRQGRGYSSFWKTCEGPSPSLQTFRANTHFRHTGRQACRLGIQPRYIAGKQYTPAGPKRRPSRGQTCTRWRLQAAPETRPMHAPCPGGRGPCRLWPCGDLRLHTPTKKTTRPDHQSNTRFLTVVRYIGHAHG